MKEIVVLMIIIYKETMAIRQGRWLQSGFLQR